MTKDNNGKNATIRETYKLVMEVEARLGDKIDKLSTDVANIKGQATVLGAVAGLVVAVVGWFMGK